MNLATIIDPHPADAVALISRGQHHDLRRAARPGGRPPRRAGRARPRARRPGRASWPRNNWYFVVVLPRRPRRRLRRRPAQPDQPRRELQRELAAVGAKAVVVGPAGRGRRRPASTARRCPPSSTSSCHRARSTPTARCCLDDLLAAEPAPGRRPGDDDLAVLMFTSGTAGAPKAAMLTHGNLLANLDQMPGAARPGASRRRRRLLRRAALVPHLRAQRGARPRPHDRGHGRARRAVRPQSAARGHREARRHDHRRRPADVGGVGDAARRSPPAPSRSVRIAASGAAQLDPSDRANAGRGPLRPRSHEGYGLTEASPVVTTGRRHRRARRHRSARRCPASRCAWSTPTATTCWSATPARSGCGAPTSSPATGSDPEATAAALDARRLAAHRRHRRGRRRRLPVPRRPGQGPHHRVGLQRVPGRGRGGARRAPRRSTRAAVVGVPHPHTGEAVKAYVVVADGRVGRGGRHHRCLRGAPGPLQVPGEGDVRRRDPPGRSAARSSRRALR